MVSGVQVSGGQGRKNHSGEQQQRPAAAIRDNRCLARQQRLRRVFPDEDPSLPLRVGEPDSGGTCRLAVAGIHAHARRPDHHRYHSRIKPGQALGLFCGYKIRR